MLLQPHKIRYPFGSSIANRTWSDVNRQYRYGFNGKEKDSETAKDNYDFGARVYDGRLGRWLSLDIYANKFPDLSAFSAFGNCPLLFVDIAGEILKIQSNIRTYTYKDGKLYKEDGTEATEAELSEDKYASEVLKQIGQLNLTATGKQLVSDLVGTTEYTTTIRPLLKRGKIGKKNEFVGENKDKETTIYFDPFKPTPTPVEGNEPVCFDQSENYFRLGHEMAHARNCNNGVLNRRVWLYLGKNNEKLSLDELSACHVENKIRSEAGAPLRTHYAYKDGVEDWEPVEETKLITESGKSLYYDKNEKQKSDEKAIKNEKPEEGYSYKSN